MRSNTERRNHEGSDTRRENEGGQKKSLKNGIWVWIEKEKGFFKVRTIHKPYPFPHSLRLLTLTNRVCLREDVCTLVSEKHSKSLTKLEELLKNASSP